MPKPAFSRLPLFLCALLIALSLVAPEGLRAAGDEGKPPLARVPGRPKVGLVLSGGGARGAAHIGVLKVLEELRVPVDIVAGTSMGSLVGGIYASGMSPEEMERQIGAIDWVDIFNDNPPRQEIPWSQKQDNYKNLTGLDLGLRQGSLRVPIGTTAGYKFEFKLTEMVGLGAGRESSLHFDNLPIPYRAAATDLESGELKVFDRGSLVKAMRASMSVPAMVAPVEIDGRLYVDGMLVRNLPVDVARKAGAEIIIAVDVGTPPLRREQLTSVAAVALQSINLMSDQNVKVSIAELKEGDILIRPELGAISTADFPKVLETIPIGVKAARSVEDRLRKLSVSEADYRTWQASRAERRIPEVEIGDVRVAKTTKRVNPEVIEDELRDQPGKIESTLAGEKHGEFNLEVLHRNLMTLYGRGDFGSVDYTLGEGPGARTVKVEGIEKPWGPNYFKLGLGYASDLSGTQRLNLGFMYRMTWLNSLGAEWRTDAQLGYTDRVHTEFLQPLAFRVGAFVAPYLDWQKATTPFYRDDNWIGEYDVETLRGGLDAGVQGKLGEIRLGYFLGKLRTRDEFGLISARNYDLRQAGITGRAVLDQLDDLDFPTAGYAAAARFYVFKEDLGSEDEYNKYDLTPVKPFSYERHALTASISYGDSPDSYMPVYDLFKQGGFLHFSGYNFDQLIGQEYILAKLVYTYRYASLPAPLGKGLYVGGSFEVGDVRNRFELTTRNAPITTSGTLFCGSLFFAADTVLGPFHLGWGVAENGPNTFYIMLGRP